MKCPHCMEDITNVTPLEKLKGHLFANAKKFKMSYEKSLEEDGEDRSWTRKAKKNADKWKSWFDAVEELESQVNEGKSGE